MVILTMVLFLGISLTPLTGSVKITSNQQNLRQMFTNRFLQDSSLSSSLSKLEAESQEYILYDTKAPTPETQLMDDEQQDMGYPFDAANSIYRAQNCEVYVGEPVDSSIAGRGRTGKLDPTAGDTEDWCRFSACQGQTIQVSLSTSQDYAAVLYDKTGFAVGTSYIVDVTGFYYVQIIANDGAGTGEYILTIVLSGQNDAGTGGDAGDSYSSATVITPGNYEGYMDSNDVEDWYSFQANAGEGIFATVEPIEKSDYDIHLYNPSGDLVYSAQYYGEDELEYPADVPGTWVIKLDMFPGWDQTKWPEDYFLYGSGPYELSVSIGGSAESPPGPIPQPDITPLAQTFVVNDDPSSTNDEYGYLATVPAANYMEDGNRFVSPIVYKGIDTVTNWFGTIDDTTQYLLDDWSTYLDRHGMTADEIVLPSDPIQAAADIATSQWTSADTAVLAVDGSDFEDTMETMLDKQTTLTVKTEVASLPKGSSELMDLNGKPTYRMFVGKEWGALTVYAHGIQPGTGLIGPRYELVAYDDWPHPYDTDGDSTAIYYPVTLPGLYFPHVDSDDGNWTLEITKIAGDRYTIPISTTDSSLTVTVTTESESYLEVFLIDPQGNVRRPMIPHWNGGPINPMHIWNGFHLEEIGFEEWRRWEPELSTEHSVEIHQPTTGKWTAIVVPHYPYGEEQDSGSIPYHITADLRTYNQKRVAAGLSASNGAVIASLEHVPLLYVTESEVPAETQSALTELGVGSLIFVNIDDIGVGVKDQCGGYQINDLNTMQAVVDHIKENSASENVITITSFATGDGFFAPAGMIAAYHGSPVLNIGEMPDAYDVVDKATSWREYGGGWYHGCRSQAHLPQMDHPFDFLEFIQGLFQGELPEPGFDLHLRWLGKAYDLVHECIDGYGLDGEGKEAYIFVSPRDTDIRHPFIRVMMGNNSYAGQIPFDTPAMDTALICRDILYAALIYANPGKDVTTSQLMNYPDGSRYSRWTTNDGVTYDVLSSRVLKESFSSHGRFYEGHCVWDGWLERINAGASVNYYTGHGSGGSGVSAQFKNVAEQFPLVAHYVNLANKTFWDAWRGYSGYDAEDPGPLDPRDGGLTSWYNPSEPGLYDFIHFKYVDQLLNNLHSEFELWQSCTTGQHFGPFIYLEHGAALWYGNAGTGSCPPADLLDDWMLHDVMVEGKSIGDAFSDHIWRLYRDFTTKDPVSLYGSASLLAGCVQVIFGDPTMTVYSPEWVEPVPISG
jgi:hypothetical protein